MQFSSEIIFQQTLHGYSKGHRLIEASCSLSHDAERMMLILTDMSGSTMRQGFESYLTGYPLIGSEYFAFGKTWYAPEMNRPGCVWTHTLLIKNSDIPRVKELGALSSLFSDPRHNPVDSYKEKLSYQGDFPFGASELYKEEVLLHTLFALYEYPSSAVFIESDNSKNFEDLILRIWNQQWPRLRRTFSFCTGSIFGRRLNDKSFDLQVIPREFASKIKREFESSIFVEELALDTLNKMPAWAKLSCQDAVFQKRNSKLKKFLWTYGSDLANGRSCYKPLAKLFVECRKNSVENKTNNILSIIEKYFPSPSDGKSLKKAIFSAEKGDDDFFSGIDVFTILLKITTSTDNTNFLGTEYFDIEKFIFNIWNQNKDKSIKFLLELLDSDINKTGEIVILHISQLINDDDFIHICIQHPELAGVFVKLNHKLAKSNVVWKLPTNFKKEILDILSSVNLSDYLVDEILTAILSFDNQELAKDIKNVFGERAVIPILNFLNSKPTDKNLNYEWNVILGCFPNAVLNWLSSRKHHVNILLLSMISSFFDPHSNILYEYDPEIWLPSNDTSFTTSNKNLSSYMAYVLAIGMTNKSTNACKLVDYSFQFVHDSLKNDSLDYNSWSLFKDKLPHLSFWRDWDKCERLRRGIVKIFYSNQWPATCFFHTIKDDETFYDIVQYCSQRDWGRNFLKNLQKSCTQENNNVLKNKCLILRKYIY